MILRNTHPEVDAALAGKSLDERIALLDAMRTEHNAAKQKLDAEARALDEKIRYHGPGILHKDERKLASLVAQLDAMQPRGWALERTHERLLQELSERRDSERINRWFAQSWR